MYLNKTFATKIIKNFIGSSPARLFMNETLEYSWVNLLSGKQDQEQAVHWSFCDCLQREEL